MGGLSAEIGSSVGNSGWLFHFPSWCLPDAGSDWFDSYLCLLPFFLLLESLAWRATIFCLGLSPFRTPADCLNGTFQTVSAGCFEYPAWWCFPVCLHIYLPLFVHLLWLAICLINSLIKTKNIATVVPSPHYKEQYLNICPCWGMGYSLFYKENICPVWMEIVQAVYIFFSV